MASANKQNNARDRGKWQGRKVVPHSCGGSNEATNLVTCCVACNSKRGNRDLKQWVGMVAQETGESPKVIISRVQRQLQQPLDKATAKEMMAKRGGLTSALYN